MPPKKTPARDGENRDREGSPTNYDGEGQALALRKRDPIDGEGQALALRERELLPHFRRHRCCRRGDTLLHLCHILGTR